MGGEVVIAERRPLTEMPWFRGVYVRVYEIIAMEGRLPPPGGIYVATRLEGEPPSNVLGFAVKEGLTVWFREEPPEPWVFAHELIHLAEKRSSVDEEVYGHNLSYFTALLAERGITPAVNPLRLFEDVSMGDVLDAINEVYGGGFRTVEEFFMFIGVIPLTMMPGVRFAVDERTRVVAAVTEVLAGAEHDPNMMRVALRLLEKAKKPK